MPNRYQRNRVYSLIVGTQDDAVEINNLEIKFEVTKTSNNREKKNQARVEIYNLSKERQKALEEDYVTVQLKVGYVDVIESGGEMVTLFTGQVADLRVKEDGDYLTKRHGTDIVTVLTIDELFQELNGNIISKTVPPGKKVKDVFLEVANEVPEISRYEMSGKSLEVEIPDGYPMSGTPRQILDQLSKTYNTEWQIDGTVLYVSDIDGTFSEITNDVPLIGQFSGLIERPLPKSEDVKRIRLKDKYAQQPAKRGKGPRPKVATVHLKILMNPSIVAGSVVKLEFEDLTGYYKVTEVRHAGDYRSDEWYSYLILSSKSKSSE